MNLFNLSRVWSDIIIIIIIIRPDFTGLPPGHAATGGQFSTLRHSAKQISGGEAERYTARKRVH